MGIMYSMRYNLWGFVLGSLVYWEVNLSARLSLYPAGMCIYVCNRLNFIYSQKGTWTWTQMQGSPAGRKAPLVSWISKKRRFPGRVYLKWNMVGEEQILTKIIVHSKKKTATLYFYRFSCFLGTNILNIQKKLFHHAYRCICFASNHKAFFIWQKHDGQLQNNLNY